MRLFTSEQMRAADSHAINETGIDSKVLMENAGTRSLVLIEKLLGGLSFKSFVIICGKGNNGGDGMVIARHLINMGANVNIFCIAASATDEAIANYNILKVCGFEPEIIKTQSDLKKLQIAMEFSDVLIDCIFGTGFKGDIKGPVAKIINLMNASGTQHKISIDLPSGACSDTGQLSSPSFRADYTICLAGAKPGLFMYPAKNNAGQVNTVDIGILQISLSSTKPTHYLMTDQLAMSILPPRKENTHKGIAGKTCIIAGSSNYQGAPVLASYGALRSGAGIVNLILPDCLKGTSSCTVLPEVIVSYLESENGCFCLEERMLKSYLAKANSVLFGPGCTKSRSTADIAKFLAENINGVLVLDADALDTITPKMIKNRKAEIIITPHPAEMQRLSGIPLKEILTDPVTVATKFAFEHNLTVVLKSAVTIIARPDKRAYISSQPNSGLARGGTGDLLSGLISGLAARGISAINAALLGVHLLSIAGNTARKELGPDAMTISEVAAYLPAAFKAITISKS